ncbi:hypothetical protein [Streptomyces wuyuanensis]|uniref:hypothetical protein n=1 Tax=Streptomyces wuyuanensis TaxID=1196353 RepID=UPI00379E7AB8
MATILIEYPVVKDGVATGRTGRMPGRIGDDGQQGRQGDGRVKDTLCLESVTGRTGEVPAASLARINHLVSVTVLNRDPHVTESDLGDGKLHCCANS